MLNMGMQCASCAVHDALQLKVSQLPQEQLWRLGRGHGASWPRSVYNQALCSPLEVVPCATQVCHWAIPIMQGTTCNYTLRCHACLLQSAGTVSMIPLYRGATGAPNNCKCQREHAEPNRGCRAGEKADVGHTLGEMCDNP